MKRVILIDILNFENINYVIIVIICVSVFTTVCGIT